MLIIFCKLNKVSQALIVNNLVNY